MIKKILCFTLAAMLTLSSFAYASSDTELIGALGGYAPDEEKTVTRGEFVYMAAGLFANGISLEKTKTPYTDVSASNQYSGAVKAASDLGWVSGYGDGTFGVNDNITTEQAVIVTLRALGYEELISVFGSYLSAANYIGLLNDVSSQSGYLTGDSAAKLMKNALEANALVQTGFGDESSWEADENIKNMYSYLGVEAVEGIVTDNGITSLSAPSAVNDGYMKISGTLVFAGDIAVSDYLGYNVRAYIKTKDVKTPELVYIENCDTKVVKIPASAIDAAADFRIIYENSYGKEETSRISNVADYIYNGIADPDAVTEDLKISEGAVVLIDNDDNGVADVVRIEKAQTAVVQSVNHDASYISMHYGTDIAVKDDAVFTVIKDGKIIEPDKIDEWNVLSVYTSKDEHVVTVYVSDKIFRGTLTEKSSDRNTLTIDGEKFVLNNDALYDKLVLGSEYEFCADMYGNVVYTLDSFEYTVAVFMDANGYRSAALADDVYVKVFTQEGIVCEFKCADKVKFGGKSADKSDIPTLLAGVPQYGLIGYNLNSEGLVSAISVTQEATPAGYTPKDNFKKTYENTEIIYQAQQKSFGGKIMTNNATVVFVLPANAADEDEYFVSGINMFVSGQKYNVVSYLAGTDDWYADYVVCIPNSEYGKSNGAILVDSINTAINEKGDNIEILKGYTEKGAVVYTGAGDFLFSTTGIKRGDIIRCMLNPAGEVCDVRWVFAADTFAFKNDSGENYAHQPRFIHGYVYEKLGNLVKISLHPNIPPAVTSSNMEIHDFSGMKLYEYDKSRKVITVISADKLTDYVTNNNVYSKLFLFTTAATPKFAVSYK